MNEPAIYDGPVGADIVASVVEMPGDAVQGPPDSPVRHADVHNVYGLSMARAAAEAMARLRPDRRSFALTRSGFAGIQRHAAVWTGDNSVVVGAPADVACRCCATSACRAFRSSAPTSAVSGATPHPSCSPAGSRPACCTR